MFIDGKIPEGYVIICTHDDHSFLVRRLGLTVECPRCGRTRFAADLATEFHAANGTATPPATNGTADHGRHRKHIAADGQRSSALRSGPKNPENAPTLE